MTMPNETEPAVESRFAGRQAQMFPQLPPAQIALLERISRKITTQQKQILAEPGDRRPMFVVLSGSIEVVQVGLHGEVPVPVHVPGSFTGEMSTLRGAAGVVRMRVREPGEVVAIDEKALRAIIQTNASLSELFMRAFILRRVGLIESQQGDVVLVGSTHSAGTLRLQQFLTRNGFPYVNLDVDQDSSVHGLLEHFHVKLEEIPVVLCRGAVVLKNPSNEEVAACLGMNVQIDDVRVRDRVEVAAEHPAGDEAGEMRHVDHQVGPDLVGNLAKARKVEHAGIGGPSGQQQLWATLTGDASDLVHVDQAGLRIDLVGRDVVEPARDVQLHPVRQVPAVRQREAHDGVARIEQGVVDGSVRLRSRVRLDVRMLGAEQLLCAVDRQLFGDVDEFTTPVVALARIAFGIFVGER